MKEEISSTYHQTDYIKYVTVRLWCGTLNGLSMPDHIVRACIRVWEYSLKSHNSSIFLTRSVLISQVKGFHGVEIGNRSYVDDCRTNSLIIESPGILNGIIAVEWAPICLPMSKDHSAKRTKERESPTHERRRIWVQVELSCENPSDVLRHDACTRIPQQARRWGKTREEERLWEISFLTK